jgi:hypothetical protein
MEKGEMRNRVRQVADELTEGNLHLICEIVLGKDEFKGLLL